MERDTYNDPIDLKWRFWWTLFDLAQYLKFRHRVQLIAYENSNGILSAYRTYFPLLRCVFVLINVHLDSYNADLELHTPHLFDMLHPFRHANNVFPVQYKPLSISIACPIPFPYRFIFPSYPRILSLSPQAQAHK